MASPADPFDRRNLLTYTSLLCGVAAVAAASAGAPNAAAALGWPAGRAGLAGLAIAAAVIADTFDGRFARRFGADPRRCALGTELDSLADAIAFGLAPPLCSALLLNVKADLAGSALWGAIFVHAACAITRLASYNVDATPGGLAPPPASPKRRSGEGGFVGIPVPLAALIWSTVLLVQPSAAVTTGVILATAAAMVLPIRIPRPTGAALAIFALWPLAVGLCHLAFAIRH
jgi:phosphatidylserine synthase